MKNAANTVMNTLRRAGFEANLVGGCVRDMVLGREPKDFDVSTNARPEQVQPLFEKTTPVGAAFGVVVVIVDGHQIEVATYRADGDYSDGRRPDTVRYSDSAEEDVLRRDFTMNGLMSLIPFSVPGPYVDPASFVVDHVGGLADMRAKLVRCIGNPDDRFMEDPARMLRAASFVARLGFTVEQNTFDAIVRNASRVKLVSMERVAAELKKLVVGPFAVQGLTLLASTGLLTQVFGRDFTSSLNFASTLERFTKFPTKDPLLGLAMFFADCSNDLQMAVAVNSLKLSVGERDTVVNAVAEKLDRVFTSGGDDASVKRFARKPGVLSHGVDLFEQTVNMTQGKDRGGLDLRETMARAVLVDRFRALTPEDVRPVPMVMGQDLIDMGFKPGPDFTLVLFAVETQQLNGNFESREKALDFARGFAESRRDA